MTPPSAANRSSTLRRSPEEKVAGGGGKKLLMTNRAASFHGSSGIAADHHHRHIVRPKTQPDLLAAVRGGGGETSPCLHLRVPSKFLVSVTVQRSLLGPVQVMASTEWSVRELVDAAVRNYVKEGRRPALPATDPSAFGLHYSQFSLQRLDPREKIIGLGSRNFFLCHCTAAAAAAAAASSSSAVACSSEVGKSSKMGPSISWLWFMDFLR